jgi:enolase-phosphatase E1
VSGPPRAVLLDVEGTTTPVDFVFETLFPFARGRMADYLAAHAREPETAADLEALRAEHARDRAAGLDVPPFEAEGGAAYARWLIDQDRKTTPLKSLQGRIWEEGYRGGLLRSAIYGDVPAALLRWTGRGARVAIFSSGSVLAQKLLFGHTVFGDLTGHLSGFFDTQTGPKREAESYRAITQALAIPPADTLFVSDIVAELDAARAASLGTALCVRRPPGPAPNGHPVHASFDDLA